MLRALSRKKRSIRTVRHYSSKGQRIWELAAQHKSKIAIKDTSGTYTYQQLCDHSAVLRDKLLKSFGVQNRTVAFLCPPNYLYVVSKWALWRSGATAVPLCNSHPFQELDYVVKNSGSSLIVTTAEYASVVQQLSKENNIPFVVVSHEQLNSQAPSQDAPPTNPDQTAILIYTSGTTGKPKGVIHTFYSLESCAQMMIKSWAWSKNDRTINILPLHHVHGILNIVMCCLMAGAEIEMMGSFNANTVWDSFQRITVFMAVPTVYAKLLEAYKSYSSTKQKELASSAKNLRLMVSGSSALPEPIFSEWESITGHRLLERYGMSEILMAISNPLQPPSLRTPGTVGFPFPGVQIKLNPIDKKDAQTNNNSTEEENLQYGELLIKSPAMFSGYLGLPKATQESFDSDGWFITGDVASFNRVSGVYSIVGRLSVDIIKVGGYKISALDIERDLLGHPNVLEVVVIGIPNKEWGQTICAIIVRKDKSQDMKLEELVSWCKERMASYKAPRKLVLLDSIPRNPMGKVNKKDLIKMFSGNE